MKKRLLSLILAVCMLLAVVPVEAAPAQSDGDFSLPLSYIANYNDPYGYMFAADVPEAPTDVAHYFYNQLTDTAKVFYNALVEMKTSGKLMSGTESVELTDKVDQKVLIAQTTGAANLLNEFGAARDAFWFDNPDVFYADGSAISIRITKTSDQKYHLFMGPGRYDTYFNSAFENKEEVEKAVEEYNAALDKIVAAAAPYSTPKDKMMAVHDAIAKSVTYRDENLLMEMYKEAKDETEKAKREDSLYLLRTAYGALVQHEGVCESYTRAFKAAMDKLNLPCVMVQGVYKHSENDLEQHIWNNVWLDGAWYGVDVTMDDPINRKTQKTSNGDDGYENHDCFLIGSADMSVHHYPSGVVSESGFEFSYPIMSFSGPSGMTISDDNAPLKVRYEVREAYGEENAGVYYVSYMGMNLTEMMQHGYYLLMKYSVYNIIDGWVDTDWGYVTPEIYLDAFPDVGHETMFQMPHVEYMEFGVTEIPYPPIVYDKIPDLWYHGDPSLLLADSGMIHNENGTYRAAPFVRRANPTQTMCWDIDGQWKHVTAEYDDILVLPEVYEKYCAPGNEQRDDPQYLEMLQKATANDVKLVVHMTDWGQGIYREMNYSNLAKNLVMHHVIPQDGETDSNGNKLAPYTIIEFDFCPSEMWADDNVFYAFTLQGVVGAWSGKATNYFGYGCAHPCAICCYKSRGFDYNCFAKPQMIGDGNIALDGDLSDLEGTKIAEEYKQRLMLVVEDTNKKDAQTMNDLVKTETDDTVLGADSYNINLTLCRKQWANLEDGMAIRIQCGFPAGYGPDDAGVTFKAYHYIKDSNGNITGVEEIPCTITPYGLLIEVRSFSPFMIAAVQATAEDLAKQEKTVALMADVGGTITATDKGGDMITLKPGESVTFTVTPDENYQLESVEFSGTNKDADVDGNSSTYTIRYEDITDDHTAIVSAKFITESAIESEKEASGLTDLGTVVIPEAEAPAEFTITIDREVVNEHNDVTLSVVNPVDSYTYQWYKVGGNNGTDAMIGTGAAFTIENARPTDNGTYYCKAVNYAGSTIAETQSTGNVSLTVNPYSEVHQHTYGDYLPNEDGTGHYKKCTDPDCPDPDKAPTDPEEHTFNNKGICTVCNYTDESKHTHDFTGETYVAVEGGHAKVCKFVYNDGKTCTELDMDNVEDHTPDDTGKCTVCGYEDITAHKHVADTKWYYDDDTGHYHRCANRLPDGSVCDEKFDITPHDELGGDHACSVCGFKSPAKTEHKFTEPYNWYKDEYGHARICDICGSHEALSNHVFNDDGICTVCNYRMDSMHVHRASDTAPWVKTDNQGHYKTCEYVFENGQVCGVIVPETVQDHIYDDKGICTVCGDFNSDRHTHVYSSYIANGELGHYRKCVFTDDTEGHFECSQVTPLEGHNYDETGRCTVCGYENVNAHVHIPDTAWHYDDASGHYHRCANKLPNGNSCEFKFAAEPHNELGENHSCSICGFIPSVNPEHTFVEPYNWYTDEYGHARICAICGSHETVTPHTYNPDGNCTVCGYHMDSMHVHRASELSPWVKTDDQGHYKTCDFLLENGLLCGEIVQETVQDHTYDDKGICIVCGDFNGEHHTHVYGGYIASGDSGHYRECEFVDYTEGYYKCTQVTPVEEHSYDETGRCTVCGYENINAHVHEADDVWHYDDATGHYHRCVNKLPNGNACDYKFEVEAHDELGGEHACSLCGFKPSAGYEQHTFDDPPKWYTDQYGHARICSVCGSHEVVTPHEFDKDGTCIVCQYHEDSRHEHRYSEDAPWVKTDSQGHYKTCDFILSDGQVCGEIIQDTVEDHTYDDKGICTVCGDFNADHHTHVYDDTYIASGDSGHYRECVFTDETEGLYECPYVTPIEEHTYDASGRCTVCGHVNETKHTHVFTYADGTENPWLVGENGHYQVCTFEFSNGTRCGEHSVEVPHNLSPAGFCQTCTYSNHTHSTENSPYLADDEYHWQECSGCQTVLNKNGHVFTLAEVIKAPTATEEGLIQYTCAICKLKSITEVLPPVPPEHQHDFSGLWYMTPDVHFKSCPLDGEKGMMGMHTEDAGTVTKQATITENGTVEYRCTVCGYLMRTEIIPARGIPAVHQNPTHSHTFTYSSNSIIHKRYCTGCGLIEVDEWHTFDQNGNCTVCGYHSDGNVIEVQTPVERKLNRETDETVR